MQRVPASDRELTDGWRAEVADHHLRRRLRRARCSTTARLAPGARARSLALVARARHERRPAAAPLPVRGRGAGPGAACVVDLRRPLLPGRRVARRRLPGRHRGLLLPHTFEVSDQLRDRAEHVVAVEVTCPPPGPAARRTITGVPPRRPRRPGREPWRHLAARAPDRDGPGAHRHPARGVQRGQPERAVLALRAVLDSDALPGAAAHRGGGARPRGRPAPGHRQRQRGQLERHRRPPGAVPAPSARPCCTTCVSPWCCPKATSDAGEPGGEERSRGRRAGAGRAGRPARCRRATSGGCAPACARCACAAGSPR